MDWSVLAAGTEEAVRAIVTLLTQSVCVLLGVFFFYSGISKMIAHSRGERQGQNTVGPVIGHLFMGALMVQLTWSINTISNTLFGSPIGNPTMALSYVPEAVNTGLLNDVLTVGVLWVYCIGFIAVIRGFVLWNALASGESRQEGAGWKGFWHVFFGACAVNLTGVLRLFLSGSA